MSADFMVMLAPVLAPYAKLVAAGFALVSIILNWIGVKESAGAEIFGSGLKFAFLCLVAIVLLVMPVSSAAVEGPTVGDVAAPLGIMSIIAAYQLVYGAYGGWSSSTYFVEEDPKALRNLPRAMAGIVIAVAIVYVLVNAGLQKAMPLDTLRQSNLPIAAALGLMVGPVGAKIVIGFGVILAATALNGNIMVAPRILYGMGRDGLFLPIATRVGAGGTPSFSLALSAAICLFLILSGGFEFLFELMGALIIFTFVLYEAALALPIGHHLARRRKRLAAVAE